MDIYIIDTQFYEILTDVDNRIPNCNGYWSNILICTLIIFSQQFSFLFFSFNESTDPVNDFLEKEIFILTVHRTDYNCE